MDVADTRSCAVRNHHHLSGLAAEVLVTCDRAQSLDQLVAHCDASAASIETTLARLMADKLIIEMEGRYLTLAVMRNRGALQMIEKRNADDRVLEAKAAEPVLHLV